MDDVYRLIMGEDAPEWRRKPARLDYGELVRRIRENLPEAGNTDIIPRVGFVLAKLKTLSKKSPSGFPDDEHVKKAVWLCLGAAAFPNDPNRTRARLRDATEAVFRMTHGVPPDEREELRARLGEPADAMARLLYFAINHQGG